MNRDEEKQVGHLRRSEIQGKNINHRIFEDLFYAGYLGSNKMDSSKLESFYKETGLLERDEAVIHHAQEYSVGKAKKRKLR